MQPTTQLDELLLEWEARQRRGESCTAEELCCDQPDLLEPFRKRLSELHLLLDAANQTGTFTTDGDRTGSHHFGASGSEPERQRGANLAPPGYEILGTLGRGGMGVVYKANQVKAKRVVALKMILTGGHASEKEQERFRLEAQSVARLQHPNIVQVFDVGEHQGNPYFALEYCEGGTLATKLNGTPLPPREAAELIEKLARAVAEAHSKGVVHRDLKPANVLLAVNGEPKVTDFGLAKQLSSPSPPASGGEGRGEGGASASDISQLTMTGAIMGTPSYMAPEQASGDTKHLGPACDIYALGAILYECLTGRPPFKGASLVETLDQVRNQEPVPPSQLNPKVPRDLETICLKCLRKEQQKRYSAARALADDLRNYLDGRPIVARPVGSVERAVKWVKRNPVITGATAAVMLALAIGGGISYAKYLDAKEQERIAQMARDEEAERVKERDKAIADEKQRVKERDKAIDDEKLRVKERDKAIDDEKKAAKEANDRLAEKNYQLGITNMLLAGSAYDNRDVKLAVERLASVPLAQRKFEWHYLKRQVQGGLFTLYGHTSSVMSVTFSPDGSRIVTGSDDQTAKVWDARTGTALLDLKGHTRPVMSVRFSPDGTRIVTGSGDKTAKVWDARRGRALLDLKGHTNTVSCAAFSPDGSRIVTGSSDQTAKVWDAGRGTALLNLKGHTREVKSVSFSPDGSRIVTGSVDGTAKVWDAKTGTPLVDLKGHTGPVESVSFSPDGSRIVTGSLDRTAKVWEAQSGTHLVDLKGHMSFVISVSFSPDGSRVVTGSDDRTAKVWDAKTGTPLVDLRGHTGSVCSVSFSPDGSQIVTGSEDWTAKVWDAKTGTALLDLKGHASTVTSVSFSPDGSRIVAGSHGTAQVRNAQTGTALFVLKRHTGRVNSVSFSPDGSRIVTGSEDKTAKVWDAQTGTALLELKGHTNAVTSVSFSPDGSRIVTGSEDKTAKVWDAQTGTALLELKGHTNAVTSVSFFPDGSRIVTGSWDMTAKVWDAQTGTALFELKGHTHRVTSVSFSPDGSRIVTGSEDMTAKVWDAQTGTALLELKEHTNAVSSVSFSPDGSRIVTGSADMTAKVWDAQTGTALLELKGHTRYVTSVAFSPDGSRIVTGSLDFSAKVWDAKTGTALLELKGHTSYVTSVSFSPDGSRIVTGSYDQTAKVWDAQTGTALLELKGHTYSVMSVTFSPDGSRIVTGSVDKTAKVWDANTGTALLELKGHTRPVMSVRFSPDGSRIVTGSDDRTAKVWDAQTGKELKGEPIVKTIGNNRISPDGKWFAHALLDRVVLLPTTIDPKELSYRLLHTRPNFHRYQEGYLAAQQAKEPVAMSFYLDRQLSMLPNTMNLNFRKQIQPDPRLIARSGFHHPPFANTRYDRPALHALAVNGDRLAKRLVAQELVRDAKPQAAIPLLFECMLSRPITHPPKPPVEELLLAQAYLDLKQPNQAKRFYRAAADWLDQPREPFRAMNIVSHFATNPWAGLGSLYVPTDDPRRNPFDWESWLECDVFRAEVEKRLAGNN